MCRTQKELSEAGRRNSSVNNLLQAICLTASKTIGSSNQIRFSINEEIRCLKLLATAHVTLNYNMAIGRLIFRGNNSAIKLIIRSTNSLSTGAATVARLYKNRKIDNSVFNICLTKARDNVYPVLDTHSLKSTFIRHQTELLSRTIARHIELRANLLIWTLRRINPTTNDPINLLAFCHSNYSIDIFNIENVGFVGRSLRRARLKPIGNNNVDSETVSRFHKLKLLRRTAQNKQTLSSQRTRLAHRAHPKTTSQIRSTSSRAKSANIGSVSTRSETHLATGVRSLA